MNDQIMGNISELLNRIPEKDVSTHHVGNGETAKFANPVERFLNAFQNVQDECAKASLDLAQWLEDQAATLRNHAATINHQATQIPDDVRRAVEYEHQVRSLIQALSVVRQ